MEENLFPHAKKTTRKWRNRKIHVPTMQNVCCTLLYEAIVWCNFRHRYNTIHLLVSCCCETPKMPHAFTNRLHNVSSANFIQLTAAIATRNYSTVSAYSRDTLYRVVSAFTRHSPLQARFEAAASPFVSSRLDSCNDTIPWTRWSLTFAGFRTKHVLYIGLQNRHTQVQNVDFAARPTNLHNELEFYATAMRLQCDYAGTLPLICQCQLRDIPVQELNMVAERPTTLHLSHGTVNWSQAGGFRSISLHIFKRDVTSQFLHEQFFTVVMWFRHDLLSLQQAFGAPPPTASLRKCIKSSTGAILRLSRFAASLLQD